MSLCVYLHAGVTANSVHPGIVMTEVMRHYPLMVRCLFKLIGFFFFKVSELLLFIVHIFTLLSHHLTCNHPGVASGIQSHPNTK